LQFRGVCAAVVGAEQQFARRQGDSHVSLGAAAVAAIDCGQRLCGQSAGHWLPHSLR
jgi:hypothetical protein